MVSAFFVIFFIVSCGGGGGGGDNSIVTPTGTESVNISGSVSGTTIIAVDDNGNIVATDTSVGKTPDVHGNYPFTLTEIPIEENIRLYFATGNGIFPMHFNDNGNDTNTFVLTNATDINIGFVVIDDVNFVAIPENNPLNDPSVGPSNLNDDVPDMLTATYRGSDYYPIDPKDYVTNLGTISLTGEEYAFSGGTGQRVYNGSLACVPYDSFIGHTSEGDVVMYGRYNREDDLYTDMSEGAPLILLPGNIQINDSWTYDYDSDTTINFSFIGWETITVPADTYVNCIKIRVDVQDSVDSFSNIHWYAKDVGIVKIERVNESTVGYSGCMSVTSDNPLAVLMQINGPSRTITGESGNQVILNGSWKTACTPDFGDGESETATLTISGLNFSMIANVWVNSTSCSGSSDITFDMKGSFVLGDNLNPTMNSSNVSAKELDITASAYQATINNSNIVSTANAYELCGLNNWSANTPKDVLGSECGPSSDLKDLIYIDDTVEPNLLYFGDDEGNYDANGYPTAVDPDTLMERM
jgi:hypothetical protein